MTSQNVALWDIYIFIALWAIYLFIVTRIFHLWKMTCLTFNELEFFDLVSGKTSCLSALSAYYNHTEIVKTLSFDL